MIISQPFLAYAAHELRGEIALQLALAEVAVADPNPHAAALRKLGEQVAAACSRQQRLLEALLTLSRGEYGSLRREPVDLAATAAVVLRANGHHRLERSTVLEPARTAGDAQLIERLVANLVENAVRHNIPRGRFEIVTHACAGRATFAIANTGPVIPAGELARLFGPFERFTPSGSADGVGLGLAIVRAIADAHGATVTAQPRSGGGLGIDVAFPALD